MIRMWRLSEAGEDSLGLACTNDGLLLGRTPLIERRDHRFVVRDQSEIEILLSRAYRKNIAADRLMSGLATVAAALNANDPCLACIAAVHLRLPDLADRIARDGMEAGDCLIKSGDWNPALHPRAGTPPNPGWFAPTEGAADESPAMQTRQNDNRTERSAPQARGDESSSVRIAQNDDPTGRSDASPGVGDDWVRLPPGPQRIDELADFVEWIANAKPQDEQTIRAEIKKYFYDAGDQGSANALNSALTVLLRPGITREIARGFSTVSMRLRAPIRGSTPKIEIGRRARRCWEVVCPQSQRANLRPPRARRPRARQLKRNLEPLPRPPKHGNAAGPREVSISISFSAMDRCRQAFEPSIISPTAWPPASNLSTSMQPLIRTLPASHIDSTNTSTT
jgi:hypothetical protein